MMTSTTRKTLREWTADRLTEERQRIEGKRDEFNELAMTHEDARWHVRDCDDILQAIDNEMARRAAAKVTA